MFVSAEVITMLACAVSIIVAFVSAGGWFINRMDARFAVQDAKLDARFEKVDARFDAQDAKWDARFVAQGEKWDTRSSAQELRADARSAAQEEKWDARFDRLEGRISGVEHELTEVKIAVARLEGPPPRLLTAR